MALDEARAKSKGTWDEMAAGWERRLDYLWDASRPVAEWMVEKLGAKAGQTVLDLAAGPGNTGFVVAQIIGPQGKLISTDFSPGMVDVARRLAKEAGTIQRRVQGHGCGENGSAGRLQRRIPGPPFPGW